mgnify:CR=1 FL=1
MGVYTQIKKFKDCDKKILKSDLSDFIVEKNSQLYLSTFSKSLDICGNNFIYLNSLGDVKKLSKLERNSTEFSDVIKRANFEKDEFNLSKSISNFMNQFMIIQNSYFDILSNDLILPGVDFLNYAQLTSDGINYLSGNKRMNRTQKIDLENLVSNMRNF